MLWPSGYPDNSPPSRRSTMGINSMRYRDHIDNMLISEIDTNNLFLYKKGNLYKWQK